MTQINEPKGLVLPCGCRWSDGYFQRLSALCQRHGRMFYFSPPEKDLLEITKQIEEEWDAQRTGKDPLLYGDGPGDYKDEL